MTRILLLIGAAVTIASLLNEGFERLRSKLGDGLGTPGPAGRAGKSVRSGGELVACATCGVHVLRARALSSAAGGSYCSETCRRSAVTGL